MKKHRRPELALGRRFYWFILLSLLSGAPGRNRTCDTRIRSPMLYPLSYRRLYKNGAGEGNRTLVAGLEGQCSTIELHPLATPMVGARGFEPPASCSQGRRADQTALRPELLGEFYLTMVDLRCQDSWAASSANTLTAACKAFPR
jgi:hypothetical protein